MVAKKVAPKKAPAKKASKPVAKKAGFPKKLAKPKVVPSQYQKVKTVVAEVKKPVPAPVHQHEFRHVGDEYRVVTRQVPEEVEIRVQVYQCACGSTEETEVT